MRCMLVLAEMFQAPCPKTVSGEGFFLVAIAPGCP
jgi:hypothetical protein